MEYEEEDYTHNDEDNEFDESEQGTDTNTKSIKWQPGQPGALAVCRYQTNGHWQAALLLFWIKWRWKKKKKIKRNGKEWVVAFAEQWMSESGLDEGEYKNHALPYLKKHDLIEVATWKFQGVRQTWIRLKLENLKNQYQEDHSFYELRRKSGFNDDTIIDATDILDWNYLETF
jgi:hypothetical protein